MAAPGWNEIVSNRPATAFRRLLRPPSLEPQPRLSPPPAHLLSSQSATALPRDPAAPPRTPAKWGQLCSADPGKRKHATRETRLSAPCAHTTACHDAASYRGERASAEARAAGFARGARSVSRIASRAKATYIVSPAPGAYSPISADRVESPGDPWPGENTRSTGAASHTTR